MTEGRAESHLPSRGGLRSKIKVFAQRHDIDDTKVQKLVGVIIVAQLIPELTTIKGGNSLSLAYPLSQARYSVDLDLAFSDDFEKWEHDFQHNLETGIDGFTGSLVPRGNPAKQPKTKGYIHIIPRNVKLLYLGSPFTTLPLDITPSLHYEKQHQVKEISQDSIDLMSYLGFSTPHEVTLLSAEGQLAQKTAALFSNPDNRPGDISDMNLLFTTLQSTGGEKLYEELLKFELSQRGVPLPIRFKDLAPLKDQYLEMTSGTPEIFDAVISRITTVIEHINQDSATKDFMTFGQTSIVNTPDSAAPYSR